MNTFYFAPTPSAGPATGGDATAVVDRVHAAWAAVTSVYPNGWQVLVNPQVDVLETLNGDLIDSFTVATPTAVLGAAANGYGPTMSMLLLRQHTSAFLGGHRVQGRAFLGPISNYADADGTPMAATEAFLTGFSTALQGAGGPTDPVHVVWSRPRLAKAGPPIVTARDGGWAGVTSYSVPDRFAVLRSRRG